jgi:hypothetical protein
MTRWRPDTCDCVIDVLDWDTGAHVVVSACPVHAGHADVFTSVYHGENKPKNQAVAAARAAVPGLANEEPVVTFGADRQPVISFTGLSQADEAKVRAELSARNINAKVTKR